MPHISAPVIGKLCTYRSIMIQWNETDKEIIFILKEAFFTKKLRPLNSDEHLRFFFIRSFFYLSLFSLATRILLWGFGAIVTAKESAFFMLPISIFFTILFLHINNKSKNPSVIAMVLTWASLQISFYV